MNGCLNSSSADGRCLGSLQTEKLSHCYKTHKKCVENIDYIYSGLKEKLHKRNRANISSFFSKRAMYLVRQAWTKSFACVEKSSDREGIKPFRAPM